MLSPKDPIRYVKCIEKQRKRIVSPETCEKLRQANIERYKDPNEREKTRQAGIKRYEDPLEHEKSRQASLKLFKDPLEIEKLIIAQNKPEVLEKQRQALIKRFQKPEEIEKLKQSALKRWENPLEHEKLSQVQKERFKNPETKEKQRKSAIKRFENPKEREKLRKYRIKQIEQNSGVCIPGYNFKACEYFKKFDKEHNTKGFYAMYGGGEHYIEELGYFPDYINFDLKLIMEWDEERHYKINGTLKYKDIIRQQEIQNLFPDFEFRRIREKDVINKN